MGATCGAILLKYDKVVRKPKLGKVWNPAVYPTIKLKFAGIVIVGLNVTVGNEFYANAPVCVLARGRLQPVGNDSGTL